MTIPSRPAPAPPQQQQTSHQLNTTSPSLFPIKLPPPPATGAFQRTFSTNTTTSNVLTSNLHNETGASITRHFPTARYAPATNWDGSPFDIPTSNAAMKKIPPPRPPPPKIAPNVSDTVLKKPGPPQSINVLSNLFGRRKGTTKVAKQQAQPQQQSQQFNLKQTKPNFPPNFPQNNDKFSFMSQTLVLSSTARDPNDAELIKFDSPPSSPTFTQKSNSDCVSVDSFSSDSNFSSPQNGSVSQPESGFEDDFLSPTDPWDAFNSIGGSSMSATTSQNYGFLNDIRITQSSVRNLDAIARTTNDNPLCNGKSLLPPQTVSMPTIIKPKSAQITSSNSSSPIHHLASANMPGKSQIPSTLQMKYSEPYCSYNDGESSPPMPSCPPPPPPSSSEMLDVIAGRLDALDLKAYDDDDGTSYGIALYDFEGTEDGDLSFKMNEKIYLLQKLNNEWYMGRNKRGCEGIFPSNYIDVKVPPKDDANISSTSSSDSQSKVRVLFNFNAEMPEDLTLKENDMVTVLSRINDEWLYGQLGNARGQFPANFIEYIPPNLPKQMP